ncbi:hypothetical protein MTO96_050735 [Rhipicephalus appendiculatus]
MAALQDRRAAWRPARHHPIVKGSRGKSRRGVERRKSAAGQRTRTEPKDFVERLTRRKSGEKLTRRSLLLGPAAVLREATLAFCTSLPINFGAEELSGVRALRVSERGQSRRTAVGSTDEAQRGAASGAEQQGKATRGVVRWST